MCYQPVGFLRVSLVRVLLTAVALGVHAEVQTWTGEGVPAPEPVVAKITLGAYIFPGWYRDTGRGDYPYRTHDEDSEWKWAVAKQPAPRPLLGFYDDSLPEVNDWHIKRALEHGISFFAFDWYWNAGEKRLARTLEQGFLKARYAAQMKFCIHWCNHALDWKRDGKPAPLDFSKPALLQMTEYLADHYFKLSNYLTVDGRPVLLVYVPGALIQANGGPAGFRAVLEEMNRLLRAKGLKDLYCVALGDGRNAAESGFSAFSAYAYYGVDLDSKYEWKRGYSLPYADMLKHFETMWQIYSARKEPHYIVPVGSNWDDRPRARKNATVITGRTPDLFEQHCRASLTYIDPRNNLAIIEAWNEWGEGSFIEPDAEFGFALLIACAAFTPTRPMRTSTLFRARQKSSPSACSIQKSGRQPRRLKASPIPLHRSRCARRRWLRTSRCPPVRRSRRGSSPRMPRAGLSTRQSRSGLRTAYSSHVPPATIRRSS